MNEHPILFSGEMVKAILNKRKTQTRRVIKDHPWTRPPYYFCGLRNGLGYPASEGTTWAGFTCEGYHSPCYVKCPYGKPGDHLWVKETWRSVELPSGLDGIEYAADNQFRPIENTRAAADLWVDAHANGKHGQAWRPSIFMPRWASRITLGVTNIRVERLQAITEDDAVAEGVELDIWDQALVAKNYTKTGVWFQSWTEEERNYIPFENIATNSFRSLWNSINLKPKPVYVDKKIVAYESSPWSAEDFDAHYPDVRYLSIFRGKPITVTPNPWVWVVEFTKVKP